MDRDGRKTYQVDKTGCRVNVLDSSYDMMQIVREDGQGGYEVLVSSDTYNEGTIDAYWENTTAKGEPYAVYRIRGDENGRTLFEFMANNMRGDEGIEWSLAQTGNEGASGLNFLTTSYQKGTEPGMRHLYNEQIKYYNLRAMIHNHPNGVLTPSGFGFGEDEFGNILLPGTHKDAGFSSQMAAGLRKANRNVPYFYIYGDDEYIQYGIDPSYDNHLGPSPNGNRMDGWWDMKGNFHPLKGTPPPPTPTLETEKNKRTRYESY